MKKRAKFSLARFFRFIYLKLFRIYDSPQRIALGFALGVFSGILPGTGPIAALFLAWLLRVNRAAALLGSLLTNTWLSIITFLSAIKLGSLVVGLDWQQVQREWVLLVQNFRWQDLFQTSILKFISPVIVGYLAIAFCAGLLAYFTVLAILRVRKRLQKQKIEYRI